MKINDEITICWYTFAICSQSMSILLESNVIGAFADERNIINALEMASGVEEFLSACLLNLR